MTQPKLPLIYCKDCSGFDCWERYPAEDWHTEDKNILEYAYRCTKCGHITLRPYEVEVLRRTQMGLDKVFLVCYGIRTLG